MVNALQVPTWPNPFDTGNYTNAYAVSYGFMMEAGTQTYSFHIKVYTNAAAQAAGKQPLADLVYRNKVGNGDGWDGVFPDWNTALSDSTFLTPLLALRDYALLKILANDARFAGSSQL